MTEEVRIVADLGGVKVLVNPSLPPGYIMSTGADRGISFYVNGEWRPWRPCPTARLEPRGE